MLSSCNKYRDGRRAQRALVTPEQLKHLQTNSGIILTKPDKEATTVVVSKSECAEEMRATNSERLHPKGIEHFE